MSKVAWVAGVDGCPAGWIVVLRPLDDPAAARVRMVATFADVLALDPAPVMIAIDVPIGLPDRAGPGGRIADVEARTVLGGRQSAVFSVPARAAVMETDYRRSCEIAAANSTPPRMVSKQAFNIFPKIREVDALMTPEVQNRVKEVHPEVAFVALNGWQALDLPKKVKSSPNPAGLALRRELLMTAGYRQELLLFPMKRKHAGPDDLLDAAVNSWAAARIVRGEARRFPPDPERDAKGLACEIWG